PDGQSIHNLQSVNWQKQKTTQRSYPSHSPLERKHDPVKGTSFAMPEDMTADAVTPEKVQEGDGRAAPDERSWAG
ncbi:MAG TPA: hypothetical protein VIM60_02715, partial [Edaphobacter sp.]